jgi:histone H3/H4
MEFSTRSIHRLIKEEGDKQVSRESAEELGSILEGYAEFLADEIMRQVEIDDKNTVKQIHVKRALRAI